MTFLKKEKTFELEGIFGDLDYGYFNLILKYYHIRSFNEELLKGLFENNKLEILSHEIESQGNNKYAHKIIFDNGKELEVVFKNLELKITDDISKNYKRVSCKLLIDEKG